MKSISCSALAHCPSCSSPIPENAKFCPQCGARCDAGESVAPESVERNLVSPKPSPFPPLSSAPPLQKAGKEDIADAAAVGKAVERLGHPLPRLVGILDAFDPMGCLVFLVLGWVIFLANPLRYPIALVYHFKADARLKKGEIAEARRLVNQCHAVNGVLYAVFILAWIIAVSVYIQD